ncbi:Uma2 family endonuclease [Lentibacillus sediminis]|uniref:Uma2 family endonuclease n=1 Tax=Lentibacillus sediminis TaxID=1940529 RepID=UPI000C1C5DBF|nr:Uma2 family endonuclease [Lentibacillus sediminis]
MSLPEQNKISVEAFYKMREDTDHLLEYADGNVFMSPKLSTRHQQVSSRLQAKLFNFLDGGKCQVFSAPYDIHLYRDDLDDTKIFIPDLSVICEEEGLEENKFVGVPELIIEILSPSNQSHDFVTKMEAYMKYGVKEYWAVNPMLHAVQVYVLTDDQVYQQVDILKEEGIAKSTVLNGFEVDLKDIFK